MISQKRMKSVCCLTLPKLLEAHKSLTASLKCDFALPAALTILSFKVNPEAT